jgi:alpha-tubulin suppressor-like RCC1 family protein
MVVDFTGNTSFACWGANEHGQLGHDPSNDTSSCPGNNGPCNSQPTPVGGTLTWVTIPGTDAGTSALAMGPTSACVLKPDSTVWCWGSASLVGNGTAYPDASTIQFTPVQVKGLPPP